MYGKVTRTFPDKGYGFILGEDRKSYFVHYSNLNGEQIARGYYVFFKPFQNERSDYNAKNITVISAREKRAGKMIFSKKKRHKRHKSCNVDKVITEDKKFKRFIKTFLSEQRKEKYNGSIEERIYRQDGRDRRYY